LLKVVFIYCVWPQNVKHSIHKGVCVKTRTNLLKKKKGGPRGDAQRGGMDAREHLGVHDLSKGQRQP